MYNYQTERAYLFTEPGQVMFLKIRDAAHNLIRTSGAASMQAIMSRASVGGDSWHMLAAVDRLVELGELKELTGPDVIGQNRVFVFAKTNS